MPSQETGGSGSGCGGVFFDMSAERHSAFVCLPSESGRRYTTSGPLRRERVGPRESPAVEGAPRVRVVSTHRRCRALSPGITCYGGKVASRQKFDSASWFFFRLLFLAKTRAAAVYEKAKVFRFVFFLFRFFFPSLKLKCDTLKH